MFLANATTFWGCGRGLSSDFNRRRWGRGVVEVRYSIYFFQPVPPFRGVVEVEVDPSNFNWRRWG